MEGLSSRFPQDKPKNMKQSKASNEFFDLFRKLTGKKVFQELSIPNPKYPEYPFRADGFIEEPPTVIEFNGKPYHQNIDREERKKQAIEQLGFNYKKVDFDIPENLIYTGKENQNEIRKEYKKWFIGWCKIKICEILS